MKKLFLVVLLVIMAAASLDARKIYIVAAGVSDYPGSVNDLNLPANDARAVYMLYRKYAGAEGILLLNNKATRSNILTKARNLFQKAKADDIVVLFFSGHGNRGCFYTYDGAMTYEEVRKIFSSCKARNKMIFADACFSGDMAGGSGAGRDQRNNIMLFFSSRDNETSFESGTMKNGFFTACLLKSLKGAADTNKDRVITAKELFVAVSEGVRSLSGNRQHPVMWGNFDDKMPVFVWK